MQELDQAITKAGGVVALSREFGIRNPHVISNWRARQRVPLPWQLVIKNWLDKPKVAVTQPVTESV